MAVKKIDIKENTGEPTPVAVPSSAQNGTVAASTLKPASRPAGEEGQMTRSEAFAAIVAAAGGIETGDLSKFLESLEMNKGSNQNKSEEGSQATNRASIVPKGVAADAMKEDVINAFKGQDLSEETLNNMTTIFESQIYTRCELIKAELQEEAEKQLDEQIQELTEEMTERVDEYLTYCAAQFMEENKLAIETNLRTEMSESFISKLKDIFKEHYIEIPDDKINVVEEIVKDRDALKTQLDEQLNLNIQASKKIAETERKELCESVAIGLSANQKIEFLKHSESVDTALTSDEYKGKLQVLKEHYFGIKTAKTGIVTDGDAKTLEELNEENSKKIIAVEGDPVADMVYKSISKNVKKY